MVRERSRRPERVGLNTQVRTRFQRWSKRPWVRRLFALAVFVFASGTAYIFAHWPTLTEIEKHSPVAAGLDQELIITGPAAVDPLFVYRGAIGEAVDARFESARLAESTIANYTVISCAATRDPACPLSKDEQTIRWITKAGSGSKTTMEIKLEQPTDSMVKVHLFRPADDNPNPHLRVRVEGAVVSVNMAVPLGDPGVDPNMPKILMVGERSYNIPGAFPIGVMVPEGSPFELDFSGQQLAQGLFDAFSLGPGTDEWIQTKAVAVRSQTSDLGQALFATCGEASGHAFWASDASLDPSRCKSLNRLELRGLKVGRESLQIEMRGTGWVALNGELITADLVALLQKNTVVQSLLASIVAVLIAWFWKTLFGK